ncbi:hypothetical protein ABZU76_38050 [Amycolatopsis sp. NPDC005232]|uniref:hypothetical protein n=1 Tax=Amycolatopsis sp. NPDC005232 TaxID=3157027 RepID=UPI0033AC3FD6
MISDHRGQTRLWPFTCLAGILQRRRRYYGGQHTNDGVYDRISCELVRYIWGTSRPDRPAPRRREW